MAKFNDCKDSGKEKERLGRSFYAVKTAYFTTSFN